ncbi:hypothetical protein KVR01_000506 [Diaporthe batatas]|uniref:uncharacterized protein n=1 Tax=Diaporthe batatas TaxID=748121 RepID=UPI001D05A5C7|nr:uncharacterized protein KVR01_000506 [Diaporthe batatas]KAG8169761.1 hypothetical protein KVR01_000506 [Diaporthe batatas]
MSAPMHHFPMALSAEGCTEIFTYIIVVFALTKLSIDDLAPEARRCGRFPPSGWLYLACILSWPFSVGSFAGLLVLGTFHAAVIKAYKFGARGARFCRRRIARCVLKPREPEDLEMGPLVPLPLERVSWDDSKAEYSFPLAEMPSREVVAILREECSLTPQRWGRAPCSRTSSSRLPATRNNIL